MTKKVFVKLYTVPMEACCMGKMNWTEAGRMLQKQLFSRLQEKAGFRHIEFMTQEWFEDTHAQEIMEKENLKLPFVLVDGKTASSGDKINISRVIRQAEAIL